MPILLHNNGVKNSKFTGMTTLERLAAAGLLKDFEIAVKQDARKAAIAMLMSVELTEEQAFAVYEGAARLRRNYGA